MFLNEFRIMGNEPFAGHRKTSVAFTFGDIRTVKKRQSITSGSNEDKICHHLLVMLVQPVPDFYCPFSVIAKIQVFGFMVKEYIYIGIIGEETRHFPGQCSEIHISAHIHFRGGQHFVTVSFSHHERNPLSQGFVVISKFHSLKKVRLYHGLMTFLQIPHIRRPEHQTHVGTGSDELLWILNVFFLHEISPELFGNLKLLSNVLCLFNIDAAVFLFGGIIELTECRMPCSRVIPGSRTFLRKSPKSFENRDLQAGLKLMEQRSQRGTHNSATNEYNIVFRARRFLDQGVWHKIFFVLM